MLFIIILLLVGLVDPVFAQTSKTSLQYSSEAFPAGPDGINFDDMIYSTDLHKVIVPAGRTRNLYLLDPVTFQATLISGISNIPLSKKGHRRGVTSADEGEDYLFAADHDTQKIDMLNVKSGTIVASAPLAGDADYVRYTGFDHEVWVTEPKINRIEVFNFTAGLKPAISSIVSIQVPHGPESLVIDHTRQSAYSNFGPQTAAIDLNTHKIITSWANGCIKSRGDAIDEQKGFLFVSCGEGKAFVFDLKNNNKQLSSLLTIPAMDVISYNPSLSHLYLTGSKNATLSVLGVSAKGQLSLLGVSLGAIKGHCVAGDDRNNIWVCDPKHSQLLRYKDTY